VVVEADGTPRLRRTSLIDGLSFSPPRGGIVGVTGPTSRQTTHMSGYLRAGAARTAVPCGWATRSGSRTSTIRATPTIPDRTVYETITGGTDLLVVGGREIHGRADVAGFNFKGSDQQKRVGDLSGGERNRLHLASVLRSGGNVLLLDEPTNDLDVDTLRALEDALLAFPGCAVVISHDRWFLDRVATHVLAFDGDSQVRWFEGNFSDYETDRRRRLGAEADQPHRLRYRPLVRS